MTFIIGFILLLLIEVMLATFLIYKFSSRTLEAEAFRSHLMIERSAQIIMPIILKVNTCVILTGILLSGLTVLIAYAKLRALFGKIIEGLKNLKNNNTSFRINMRGEKNTREFIKEFNQAASFFDHRLAELRGTLDSLISEKELKQIIKKHDKLYSLIADK